MPLAAVYTSHLRPDTALVSAFQQSGDYDYSKELFKGDFSIWSWLWTTSTASLRASSAVWRMLATCPYGCGYGWL